MERVDKSKIAGALLGTAIGDSLGRGYDRIKKQHASTTPYVDGLDALIGVSGPSSITQLALFTAAAIADSTRDTRNERGLRDFLLDAYLAWGSTQERGMVTPPLGVVSKTRQLLLHPLMQSVELPNEQTITGIALRPLRRNDTYINKSKGSSPLSRIAPLGFTELPFANGLAAAQLTHGPETALCAGSVSLITHLLADDIDVHDAVSYARQELESRHGLADTVALGNVLDALKEADQRARQAPPKERDFRNRFTINHRETPDLGFGYLATHALSIATYACMRAETAQEALEIAVFHQGKSSATASIAGAMWGAAFGVHAFSQHLRDSLGQFADLIDDCATDLAGALNREEPSSRKHARLHRVEFELD